jgi:hypothetical protein
MLFWKQNAENDVKGCKVYFGKTADFEYSNSIDVGLKNFYKVPIELLSFTDFTVTAYDKDADGNKDFFEGHESWFSEGQTELGGVK